MNHDEPAAVIGTRPTADATAIEWAMFSETCWGCVLEGRGPGPCKDKKGTASLDQLTPGTLVHADPEPAPGRLLSGTGIVVETYGPAATADMVVVWLWSQGTPVPGGNTFAYFPRELTPLRHHLASLPPQVFDHLAALTRHAEHLPGYDQLAAAVRRAAALRS